MKIIQVEQGTPEWFAARLGYPTASEFDRIITAQGKPSTQQKKYMFKLAGEKVSGKPEETYQNGTMLRGKEMEAEAREAYQLITDNAVEQVGFCVSKGYGCSPDGFIGKDGLLEIKCPTIAVHVGYLIGNALPEDYFQQVQGQLLVTGRKWCDFFSYYPGLKPLLIRVNPDKKFIALLEQELGDFCDKLAQTIIEIA